MSWSGACGPGSATLTATPIGGGTYVVTPVTGDQNGNPVALLAPGAYGDNDNEIFPANAIQLDFAGLGFTAGGLDYNLFAYTLPGNTNTYTECESDVARTCTGGDVNSGLPVDTLTIAAATSPVPELASIALVGTMAIGVTLRRRRTSKA